MTAVRFNVMHAAILNSHRDGRVHGAVPQHDSKRLGVVRRWLSRYRRRLVIFMDLRLRGDARRLRKQDVKRRLLDHHHTRRGRITRVAITIVPEEPRKPT